MKRALVFHDKGIAGAEGQITDWIIHEYRLQDYTTTSTLPMVILFVRLFLSIIYVVS
jgi:hypothetical protein